MDAIRLYALPDKEPWTLDKFLEEIKKTCRFVNSEGVNYYYEKLLG